MAVEAEIAKELDALINEAPSLIKLLGKKDAILEFGVQYQGWYSRALKIVELLGADRLDEFCSYYRADAKRKVMNGTNYVIQDYVNGFSARTDAWDKPLWDIHNTTGVRLYNQTQILQSLRSRLDSVLADVRGHMLAEIEDDELAVAARLLKVNLRAAGAVAGVVLEAHLQRVAKNHKIVISKRDPTISDLNDPLKNAAVYDIPTWRRIQHLADIRNLCDHRKSRDPTEPEVADLITGVSRVVKTIF